jgi:23S rRNA pseudouridine2605 synthase
MPEERIQKLLARSGYGSRRANEELIAQGRVTLNGKVAILGNKADLSKDIVKVDGQQIRRPPERNVYIALNKPKRVLSDTDPNDPRPTVHDMVESKEHLFSVGRLDYDSEGLILLTNDGDLAHRLTHPRYGHEKEYRVLVIKRPDEEQLAIWRRGVVLADGYRTAPAIVTIESSAKNGTWLNIVMKEGKKRQIREVGKTIGLPVLRIIRVRIGTLMLGNLKPGEWRSLKPDEIMALKKSVKLE